MIPAPALQTGSFLAVCALAGALAVPLHPVASPVAAMLAALVGLGGLRVWRWSGLFVSIKTERAQGAERLVQPVLAMGIGLIVGLFVLTVLRLAIQPAVPEVGARLAAAGAMPVWRRLVVIYVAAVGEELVFRLLLLSFVVGVASRSFRHADATPSANTIRVATGVSALTFAAVHLPAWSAVVPLSCGLVLAVLSLNTLGGLTFGWIFVRRGIGAAIWTHAGADVATQLIGPLTR